MVRSHVLPLRIKLILFAGASHLLIGFVAAVGWGWTGSWSWLTWYFDYQGALFLVSFALIEVWLAWSALRCFSRDDYLRPAWFLIMTAAVLRLVGFVLSEVFGKNSFLNPIRLLEHNWGPDAISLARNVGLVLGGPVAIAALCLGLLVVRSAYKQHGLLARLTHLDLLIVSLVVVFSVRELYDGLRFTVAQGGKFGVDKILSFATEPLISILLYVALAVRRSAVRMAGGLVAKCWMAYAMAAFLTVAGNIGLWATAYGHVPWSFQVVIWYIWFFASIAFALGPAYQVEAIRRATS